MADVKDEELTRRMIDEAARMLAEQGPAGLSLRKLAAACGTSTMAVYTRFGDKPHLLSAMRREGFRRLGQRMRVTSDDPLASLADLGRAYRLAALESRHLYGLMFGAPPAGLEPTEDDEAAADATYAPLVEAVSTAVSAGRLLGDPQHIALHLWVVAHGMVGLELAGHLPRTGEAATEAYDRALVQAVLPFLAPG